MDGAAALRLVLVGNGALTALVPAEAIVAGEMPQGTPLPAITIESVSLNDRNIPNPSTTRHVQERVDVMVHARNVPTRQQILRAVRKAAADKFPTVSGIANVTIHTDGMGPPFMNEEAAIYLRTQTFRVEYNETR